MRGSNARRGLTLVEVTVATLLLTLLGSSLGLVLQSTASAYRSVTVSVQKEARARRTMTRVKELLRGTSRSTVDPQPGFPAWDTWVEFQRVSGQSGGAPTWDPLERIALRSDPRDPDDGVDNDGDGLIDERELVWTRNVGQANERTLVLARHVAKYHDGELPNGIDDNGNQLIDEPGACFTFEDGTVTFRMTVEQANREGEIGRGSYETTLTLLGD